MRRQVRGDGIFGAASSRNVSRGYSVERNGISFSFSHEKRTLTSSIFVWSTRIKYKHKYQQWLFMRNAFFSVERFCSSYLLS